jgi:hypothetical protein
MGKIIPTDFHIFQDGYCTTKQLWLVHLTPICHPQEQLADPNNIRFFAQVPKVAWALRWLMRWPIVGFHWT